MKRTALSVMLTLAWPLGTLALEVPLKYERHSEAPQSFRPHGWAQLELSTERPAGEWQWPKFQSKQPLYGFWKSVDGDRLLVLDSKKASEAFRDRIYFDANANRDLTDDPVLDGEVSPSNTGEYQVEFEPVDIKVAVAGKALPYAVGLWLRGSDRSQASLSPQDVQRRVDCSLRPDCSYTGVLAMGGRKYRLALGDQNCNGSFADHFTITDVRDPQGKSLAYPQGDGLYIAAGENINFYDGGVLGDQLFIGGKLFDVKIDQANSKLVLTEVTEPLAPLRLAMQPWRLTACTTDGKHCVVMVDPGTNAAVAAGTYRLLDYQCVRKDKSGSDWRVIASGAADSAPLPVQAPDGGTMTFGEPYAPAVTVDPRALRQGGLKSNLRLSLVITGAGGETLREVARISGSKTEIASSAKSPNHPREPSYKILKADGEVVDKGNFEYG